ncbi:MAG: rhomboid family intramembrane serine protease [Pseudomonadota bacterium]
MFSPKDTHTVLKRFTALFLFVGALWLIQAINSASNYALNGSFGLVPRDLAGLDGVLGMPFLHVSYEHLISNTAPLVMMGALLAATATRALVRVNTIIIVLGGVLVWLLGSHAIHIGASGLIFGWFGFLVARGLVDRSPVTLASSAAIAVIYGSMVWGVLPGQEGISWEAHLFGCFAGVVAALVVRSHVHAPRMRNVEKW